MRDYWSIINQKDRAYFRGKPYDAIPGLVELFKSKKANKILDIGPGFGRNFIYLAKKGFDVYGFDSSKLAVKELREKIKKEKLNGHIILHDMNKKFPYRSNFFDAVLSISVMHHSKYENIKKIIAEIERVLKKNGMLFVSAPIRPHKREKAKKIGYRTYVYLEGKETGVPHFFFNEQAARKLFKNFGLKIKLVNKHNQLDKRKTSNRLEILAVKK